MNASALRLGKSEVFTAVPMGNGKYALKCRTGESSVVLRTHGAWWPYDVSGTVFVTCLASRLLGVLDLSVDPRVPSGDLERATSRRVGGVHRRADGQRKIRSEVSHG